MFIISDGSFGEHISHFRFIQELSCVQGFRSYSVAFTRPSHLPRTFFPRVVIQLTFTCSKSTIETLEQSVKYEICSKLTTKTPKRLLRRHYGVFIANLKQISHLVLVFLLLTFNRKMSTDWLKLLTIFWKKNPSKMFDWALNMPLLPLF